MQANIENLKSKWFLWQFVHYFLKYNFSVIPVALMFARNCPYASTL